MNAVYAATSTILRRVIRLQESLLGLPSRSYLTVGFALYVAHQRKPSKKSENLVYLQGKLTVINVRTFLLTLRVSSIVNFFSFL